MAIGRVERGVRSLIVLLVLILAIRSLKSSTTQYSSIGKLFVGKGLDVKLYPGRNDGFPREDKSKIVIKLR